MLWSRRWFLSGRRCSYIVPVVSDDTICTYSVACRCSAFHLLRMCLHNICIPFLLSPNLKHEGWISFWKLVFEGFKGAKIQKATVIVAFILLAKNKNILKFSVLIIGFYPSPNLKHYRTCLKEPLLHCKYKYSFLFTQIILIFLYTKVFDWLLFGGSCLI